MRKTVLPLVLAALLTPVIPSAVADDAADKAAFEKAYHTYRHLLEIGHPGDAVGAAKDAYTYGRKVYGENNKNTAALALNYGQLARGDEARKALAEALAIYEDIYGKDAVELIDPLTALAGASMTYGDPDAGYSHYKRALKLAETHTGEDSLTTGEIRLSMGKAALSRAQSRDAGGYLKRAKQTFEKLEGEDARIQLAQANFWLGKFYLATDRQGAATTEFLNSLDTLDKVAPSAQITMSAHAFLIQTYEERGMRDEATKHCKAISAAKPFDPNQDYLPVYFVQPKYPPTMIQMRREGTVVVSVTVDADGFVKDPRVLRSDGGQPFEGAAIAAVKKFRYVPRFKDGQTVDTKNVKYRFKFNLAN